MNGRVLVAVLLGCLVFTACGTDSPPATSSSAPGPAADQASGALFLVGQQDATAAAAALLGAFETRINATPGAADTVLFTVSAEDGPMPQTREQVEALRDKQYGAAAILLVRTDRVDDPELRALVIQETRDLLARNAVPRAAELPVIIGEDPNIALLIRGVRADG